MSISLESVHHTSVVNFEQQSSRLTLLMVILSIPPLARLLDSGSNLLALVMFLLNFLHDLLRRLFLLVVERKDTRSVLSTSIGSLLVHLSWVVHTEEEFGKFCEGDLGGIVNDFVRFCVLCRSRAYLSIVGVLQRGDSCELSESCEDRERKRGSPRHFLRCIQP